MTPEEFFYNVAQMRDAQKRYFQNRDRRVFLACRKLENIIDHEIARVKDIISQQDARRNEVKSHG